MIKDDFVEGLNTANELADSASMMKDMEEMGFSKSKMAGGMVAGGFKSIIGRKIASSLEKNKKFKGNAFKFKNAVNNPGEAILEQSEKFRTSDAPGSEMLSNFLYQLGNMFKADDPRSLYTFKKEDPEDPAIFNYRTQNSIIKVIPNLLSKIYGAVEGLRTGTDPQGHEVTWNDATDKFETKDQIAAGVKAKVRKSVSDKMGYSLTNMLERIDPKKKLSPDEQSIVMSSLVKYLQENKDVTPLGLIKGKKNFLSYLPEDISKKVKRPVTKIVASSKNDNYTYDDVKYNLSSILNSVPNLQKEVGELFKSGNKGIAEELGLMITNEARGTSHLDRNGVFAFIQEAIKEHGVNNLKQDISKQDELAKYSGEKTNAELDKARRKEQNKRMHKSKTLDEIVEEGKRSYVNGNAKFREKMDIQGNFETAKSKASDVYNASLEENFNSGSSKAKEIVETLENSTAGQNIKAGADVAKKEATKLYKTGLEQTLKAIETIEKSKTLEEVQINLNLAKESKTAKKAKKILDEVIEKVKGSTLYTKGTKEYKEQKEKLEVLMKEHGLDTEIAKLKDKLTYDEMRSLYSTLEKEGKEFVEINKKKSVKDIVENVTDTVKTNASGIYNEASNVVGKKYDDLISNKTPMKRYGVGTLTPSEYGQASTVKAINAWGYTPEESRAKKDKLKELDPVEENKLREFFFKSTAYTSGMVTDFSEYAKTFGFKTSDDTVNKLNFVDGINKMAKNESDKLLNKGKETILDHFKLTRLKKEEEDAYRFEFYTSPEYKSGSMTDFSKWLKDKGLRPNKSMDLSITGILRKTREWDRKIFNAMIKAPIKAIAKAPWAAGKALKAGGAVAKPFAKLAGYALDGVASTVGLGFMGVDDNKFIKSGKDKIKDILNNRKLSKGVNAPSSGLQQPSKQHMKNLHKINNWGYSPEDSKQRQEDYAGATPEERFVKAYRRKHDIPDDQEVNEQYEPSDLRNNVQKTLAKTRGAQGSIVKGIGKGIWNTGVAGKNLAGGIFRGGKKASKKFDYRILNPFSKLSKKDEQSPEEFMKDYEEKSKPKTSKYKKDTRAKLKPEHIEATLKPKAQQGYDAKPKAFNDSDGDGMRDGDWRSRLKEMSKKREPGVKGPEAPKSTDDKKENPLMKYILPALMALVGTGGKMLAGVLGFIPGVKPMFHLLTKSVVGLAKLSGMIAKGVIKGVKFLGKIPMLLTGLGSKITSMSSSLLTGIKGLATGAMETLGAGATAVMTKGKELVGKGVELVGSALDKAKAKVASIIPDTIKGHYGKVKDMIFKKLGKKAGGKVALTLAGKIASRAVPIAGWALLTYDVAMVGKDMLENNTSLEGAISKQLLGFDIFNPDEPAIDEEGNAIQPDEQFSSDDMAKTNSSEENGENKEDSKGSVLGGMYSSAIDKAKSVYKSTKESGGSMWDSVKNTATTAINWGKDAIGGLMSSIPMPNGNGSWQALKDTIMSASKAAGVDDKLMAVMGAIESGFNYTVKAGSSSATGLYQFLKSTWDGMLNKYGAKYGIAPGTAPTDPRANALMGAEFLKENMASLKGSVNRELTYTDAYMAHFLGAGGAKKFLSAMEKNPGQNASEIFSAEAGSNPSIFYVDGDKSRPRTLGDIYNLFTNKINSKSKEYSIDTSGGMSAGPVATTSTGTTSSTPGSSSSPTGAPTATNTPLSSITLDGPTTRPNTTPVVDNKPSAVTPSSPTGTTPNLTPTKPTQEVVATNNMLNSNSIANETNKTLGGISATLTKSLEVQMKMVEFLDKISQANTRDISKEVTNVESKGNTRDNANLGPANGSNTSYEMPMVSIDLKRKVY